METKICTVCGEEKPATLEYFSKQKGGKYGLRGMCKKCKSIIDKPYRDKHSEEMKKYHKQYRKENREKTLKYGKQYREEHKEEISKHRKIYNKNNKEKGRIYAQQRRSRKRKTPNTLTENQWIEIKSKFNNKCAYCGQEMPLEQEHFIPLSKGGDYSSNNIIPACMTCNRSKFNKDFFEWYPSQEFYSKQREIFILNFLGYKEYKQQLKMI